MTPPNNLHCKKVFVFIIFLFCQLRSEPIMADTIKEKQDAFVNNLEERVRSTLLFGGSSPIGFSGEGRIKIQYHDMRQCPPFMESDKSWLQSGWQGNQGMLKLGMIVALGRNVTLYSKIGFQSTFPGNYTNDKPTGAWDLPDPGYEPCQENHDHINDPAYIHEDMMAGIALRTRPASFMLTLGGLQWIEASPLTVWDYQRRLFAWDYLPFESEEPLGIYYGKNIIKGERTGRAAWNKKPFNGIGLESIDLPLKLYMQMFYGSFPSFDRHEREYTIKLEDDLAYYSLSKENPVKSHGLGNSYRHAIVCRAARDFPGNVTAGLNFSTIRYDSDITNNSLFISENVRPFYKEPIVISMDARGKPTDYFALHVDAALGRVDTGFFVQKNGDQYPIKNTELKSSACKPAIFASIKNDSVFPASLEFFYAAPGFYSPFSFAKSVDGFYPFGANCIGPGNFVASAYTQNLVGFNLHLSPPGLEGSGHCILTYGNHRQVRPGPDALFFPYRLNGADLFSVFQTSFCRWGYGLLDDYFTPKYRKRLGDESSGFSNRSEAGGIRSDELEIYEGFVPYENATQAQANSIDANASVIERSQYVPFHRKYAFNLALDAAYDIGKWVGWNNGVYLSVYAAINGISTTPKVLTTGEQANGMLLWGDLIRFEPAIALSEKLYILGISGFENWRAATAWTKDPVSASIVSRPIDYRDFAWGLGCDWQAIERVGLHGRCKWMNHDDVNVPENNWKTPIVSGEIKMWF